VLFIYITRLASKEIFLPSNKIHREGGRAKDISAFRVFCLNENLEEGLIISQCFVVYESHTCISANSA
jgi:hypothetical protein